MISTGAAFAIALTALIVGIIIGGLAHEHPATTGGHEGDENPGLEGDSYIYPWQVEPVELDEAVGRVARDIAEHHFMTFDEACAAIERARKGRRLMPRTVSTSPDWAELNEAADAAYRGAHVFDREVE